MFWDGKDPPAEVLSSPDLKTGGALLSGRVRLWQMRVFRGAGRDVSEVLESPPVGFASR